MTGQEPRIAMFMKFMEFYGLREVPGEVNNPVIVGWFKDIGHPWVQDDETAWCSALINWLAWYLHIERSGQLDARSWLRVGKNIPLAEAKVGHVVTFWRESPDSWKGHVGLLAGVEGNDIYVAGGNQGNQANISPYLKNRLLAVIELDYI